MTSLTTRYTHLASPLGPLLLTGDGTALTGLFMTEHQHGPHIVDTNWRRDDGAAPFELVRQQLAAYFAGTLQVFDLPLAADGTVWQQQVWRELLTIPYGTTLAYGDIAQRLGNPGGSRAVGLANGRNPISIVVPCHRVIGANGKLTGYGGGMARKQALLYFESAVLARGPHDFADAAELYLGAAHSL